MGALFSQRCTFRQSIDDGFDHLSEVQGRRRCQIVGPSLQRCDEARSFTVYMNYPVSVFCIGHHLYDIWDLQSLNEENMETLKNRSILETKS